MEALPIFQFHHFLSELSHLKACGNKVVTASDGVIWSDQMNLTIAIHMGATHSTPLNFVFAPLPNCIKSNDFHPKATGSTASKECQGSWLNGTNIKNSQHLVSCARTLMFELLSSLTSGASGSWTNNESARGADRVDVKQNWPHLFFCFALWWVYFHSGS